MTSRRPARWMLVMSLVCWSGGWGLLLPQPAWACGDETKTAVVNGQVVVVGESFECGGEEATEGGSETVGTDSSAGESTCVAVAGIAEVDAAEYCGGASDQNFTVGIGAIARAVWRLPLPAADLRVQPPGGRTLVNFATNFFKRTAPIYRTIDLARPAAPGPPYRDRRRSPGHLSRCGPSRPPRPWSAMTEGRRHGDTP